MNAAWDGGSGRAWRKREARWGTVSYREEGMECGGLQNSWVEAAGREAHPSPSHTMDLHLENSLCRGEG